MDGVPARELAAGTASLRPQGRLRFMRFRLCAKTLREDGTPSVLASHGCATRRKRKSRKCACKRRLTVYHAWESSLKIGNGSKWGKERCFGCFLQFCCCRFALWLLHSKPSLPRARPHQLLPCRAPRNQRQNPPNRPRRTLCSMELRSNCASARPFPRQMPKSARRFLSKSWRTFRSMGLRSCPKDRRHSAA